MEFKLVVLGGELFGLKFERAKKEIKPTEVFNNCVFDNRQPIIQQPTQRANQSDLMMKTVKGEDYSALCEIISEKTGVPTEKVDQILKTSAEYIKGL